jgi:hypothetical protein
MKLGRSALCRARSPRSRQEASDGRDRSVERKLSQDAIIDGVARDRTDGHQAERDGKIVVASFLGEIGGSEIDGDAPGRKPKAYGVEGAAHALAALGDPLSGRPTMVKAGMPGPIWIWTSTPRASIPSKATVVTRANIAEPPTPAFLHSSAARTIREHRISPEIGGGRKAVASLA